MSREWEQYDTTGSPSLADQAEFVQLKRKQYEKKLRLTRILQAVIIAAFVFSLFNLSRSILYPRDHTQTVYEELKALLEEDPLRKCPSGQRGVTISDVNELKETYRDIQKVKPYPELPICLLVADPSGEHVPQIQKSISTQRYSNFKAIYMTKTSITAAAHSETVANYSYTAFKQTINKNCQTNALVFVVSSPLAPNALHSLNDLHQSYSAWISYSLEDGVYQVHAFYRRVFDLVEHNDFGSANRKFMSSEKEGVIALSMLELCPKHKKSIPSSQLYIDSGSVGPAPITVSQSYCIARDRVPYQPLFSLSQGYEVNVSRLEETFRKFHANRENHYNGFMVHLDRGITQDKGFKAIENEELTFLPKVHSLAVREQRTYDSLYSIRKYAKKELPFCITVMSHNNVQQERYQRVMLSILNQQYSNYHIVFLDDVSDDGNLEKTRDYMNEMGFPRERITYVANLERKYATYNIVHAAHSYCKTDDIQLLLDGDDEFIGRYVLQLNNALYQQNRDLWLIYTTYISNFYTYGESKDINYQLDGWFGKRKIGHYIGPTRTWYVKLIRQIPLEYHQFKNGTWLDTMYDDSLQYSFYELCTNERIKYFPEFTYLYNSNYGDNDSSSPKKNEHRRQAHKEQTSFKRLKPLATLDQDFPPNQRILDVFERDRDTGFRVVAD